MAQTLYDILREYQKEAVSTFLEKKKGIVVLPTGTGKTYVAITAIKELLLKREIDDYIITVPTLSLALQWEKVMKQQGLKAHAYLSNKGGKSLISSNIFAYPSFEKLVKITKNTKRLFETKTMLVIDEVHHAHKGTKLYNAVTQFNAEYILGLSATLSSKEQYPLPTIYKKTYADLKKYIPKVELYEVQVEPDYDFMVVYRELTKTISNSLKKIKMSNLSEAEKRRIYNLYTRSIGRRHTLIATYNKVIRSTTEVVGFLQGKTLIFTLRIESIKALKSEIEKMGKIVIPILSAEDLTKLYNTNWDVIIAAKRLGEGVDLPEVENIVLSSYPSELRTLIQEIGRGMRGNVEKTLVIVAITVKDTYNVNAIEKLAEFLGTSIIPI